MHEDAVLDSTIACMCLFVLTDEDPALRELAEMERESCLQDIQDLSKKVGDNWDISIFTQFLVLRNKTGKARKLAASKRFICCL